MNGMLRNLFLAATLIAPLTAWSVERDPNDWELAKEEDGVTVMLRHVEGYKIKEFKGTAVMRTRVADLAALYLEGSRCSEWVPDCKTSSITSPGPGEYRIYREMSTPWPVKNRNYLLQARLFENSETGGVIIKFEDIQDDLPDNKCCVRMSRYRGFWEFAPLGQGRVRVTYQNHFHPGGNFPATVVNSAIAGMPFETLVNMKEVVERQ